LNFRRSFNVSVAKIVAFEKQGQMFVLRKRIGKAITEIQLCRMTAAPAEVPVRLSRNSRLRFSYRLDPDPAFAK